MPELKLYFFGPLRVERAAETIEISLSKVKALLAYLVISRSAHSRDTLATLFWPESDQRSARASLRRTLYRLNKAVGDQLLQVSGDTIGCHPEASLWTDVEAFRELATLGLEEATGPERVERLEQAIALHHDDFLAGFTLPDCREFDEWQFLQREELRRTLAQVLISLATLYKEQKEWEKALHAGRRWLALDPLHEPAHRHLMHLYALAGQQAAALRQYEECVHLLAEELAVDPETQTVELYHAIRSREVGPAAPVAAPLASAAPQAPAHTLPAQTTSFIGREHELADLRRLLAEPGCRLLTLVGVGGIGKTRLAIEVAGSVPDLFPDGIYYVPLQPVQTEELLLQAIAAALHYSLSGDEDLLQQLQRFLRRRQLLLYLDNFEQLLPSAPLLAALLEAGAGLKILVTSREALRLQEEWIYPLEGLAVNAEGAETEAEEGEAVQLFVERARRARPSFTLQVEAKAVTELCRLVEGMPLAIELAASWLSHLTTAEVLAEIQRNLDFLSTTMRNVPDRHRSIRAVLEHAWNRLTPAEQILFARLSVFRGGFRREAAEGVAAATLPLLTGLVSKALLRWDPDGRYQIHELLRQFGEGQLERNPSELARAQADHATYYARFLAERAEQMQGHRQREVNAEIRADLDNIRVAWHWMVSHGDIDKQIKVLPTLDLVFHHQSGYQEGARMVRYALEQAEARLAEDANEETAYLVALLNVDYAWLCLRLGRLDEARVILERSIQFFVETGRPFPREWGSDPRLGLSAVATTQGAYEEAQRLASEALSQARADGHSLNHLLAHYFIADAALSAGDYQTATIHGQQARDLAEKVGDRWFLAYCLNQLGHIASAGGDLAQAAQCYRQSHDIRQQFNDAEGMALALHYLGGIALRRHNYKEAATLYRRSVALYENTGDRGGMAAARRGLARAALALEDYATARTLFAEALQTAAQMSYTPLLLAVLVDVGGWLAAAGSIDVALKLFRAARYHPAAEYETQQQARARLAGLGASLDGDPVEEDDGRLELLVRLAQQELASVPALPSPLPAAPLAPAGRQAGTPTLVEPLTERELEVLALLAQGLTNAEVAEQLTVVVGTVKAHNNHIYGKLGVRNRVEAVERARNLNLI